MTVSAMTSSAGFDLTLELDRGDLLPGRLVDGTLTVHAPNGGEIRGALVTLVGVETWRYDQTETDANGHMQTKTYTKHQDLPHVPVAVLGTTSFTAGESRTIPYQLPVPSLGPATFEATELRVDWEVRANLDIPGFDAKLEMPVRVLQPTALLRAGVIDLGEFALYPEAAVTTDGASGQIWLDPVPLVVGAPFKGRLTLGSAETRTVQEVRLELRVHAKATVSGGREETVTVWSDTLVGAGSFGGGAAAYEFSGAVPADPCLPSIQTAHGRTDASFVVVIAVAWAQDPHLTRDVAIASTAEL